MTTVNGKSMIRDRRVGLLSAALAMADRAYRQVIGGHNQERIRSRFRRHYARAMFKRYGRSKYRPHQGKKECARRVRQGLAGQDYRAMRAAKEARRAAA